MSVSTTDPTIYPSSGEVWAKEASSSSPMPAGAGKGLSPHAIRALKISKVQTRPDAPDFLTGSKLLEEEKVLPDWIAGRLHGPDCPESLELGALGEAYSPLEMNGLFGFEELGPLVYPVLEGESECGSEEALKNPAASLGNFDRFQSLVRRQRSIEDRELEFFKRTHFLSLEPFYEAASERQTFGNGRSGEGSSARFEEYRSESRAESGRSLRLSGSHLGSEIKDLVLLESAAPAPVDSKYNTNYCEDNIRSLNYFLATIDPATKLAASSFELEHPRSPGSNEDLGALGELETRLNERLTDASAGTRPFVTRKFLHPHDADSVVESVDYSEDSKALKDHPFRESLPESHTRDDYYDQQYQFQNGSVDSLSDTSAPKNPPLGQQKSMPKVLLSNLRASLNVSSSNSGLKDHLKPRDFKKFIKINPIYENIPNYDSNDVFCGIKGESEFASEDEEAEEEPAEFYPPFVVQSDQTHLRVRPSRT